MNTHSGPSTTATGRFAAMRPMLEVLVLDIGLALLAYYGMRLLGFDEHVALLVGALAAGLRVVWVALRRRSFDAFAGFLAMVLGVGLALSLLTGDARFLLLKESLGTALIGLVILGSSVAGAPLVRTVVLGTVAPDKAREIEDRCRTSVVVRRSFAVMSAVWGVGLLAEAILRIPLVYLLSVDVMAGVSQGLFVLVIVLLSAWTSWYGQRVFGRELPVA